MYESWWSLIKIHLASFDDINTFDKGWLGFKKFGMIVVLVFYEVKIGCPEAICKQAGAKLCQAQFSLG